MCYSIGGWIPRYIHRSTIINYQFCIAINLEFCHDYINIVIDLNIFTECFICCLVTGQKYRMLYGGVVGQEIPNMTVGEPDIAKAIEVAINLSIVCSIIFFITIIMTNTCSFVSPPRDGKQVLIMSLHIH